MNTDATLPSENPPLASNGGFEDESVRENPTAEPTPNTRSKKSNKTDEMRANFMAVFGHGIGKFAIITVVIVVIVLIAFAMRGFNSKTRVDATTSSQVDVASAPQIKITVDPINQKEADKRNTQANLEAEAASKKGQTYQPDFNPAVVTDDNASARKTGNTQPQINVVGQPPLPPSNDASAPVPISVPAGKATANAGNNQAQGQGNAQLQEEQRRQNAELERQRIAREKLVDQIRSGVIEQVEGVLGNKAKDGSARSSYTILSYLPPAQASGKAPATKSATNGAPLSTEPAGPDGSVKNVIFKAGKAIFATLDSEVNTDDGGEVFATIHGGIYDKAKLIGKIEQARRNIGLRFSVLAPQDERPTLTINAIAIREQDAKQGVAETIDNHTIERYAALFAGSFLSGIGKAALQPQGDTIVLPNGQVIVSSPPIDNKRLAMYALGEIGINAGAEVRKSFSQPPTYSTPAKKGIGVIFLTDVNEK